MLPLDFLAEHLDLKALLTTQLGFGRIEVIGGDSIRIECPNPEHKDAHPSCFISKSKLVYNCFGCGEKGNLYDLIRIRMDLKSKESEDFLYNFCGLGAGDGIAKSLKPRYNPDATPEYRLPPDYRLDWRNASDTIKDFVQRRKFNLDLFMRYYIGFNETLKSITMPVIYKDKILNVGERFINPLNPAMKIMYRKGSKLERNIWGLFHDYDKKAPIFTEGIFDAVRLREAGFNAYALLNNQLPDDKMQIILDHFPDPYMAIAPDNDKGGETMIQNWRRMLHHRKVRVIQIVGYKDIDEIPLEQIEGFVRTSVDLLDLITKTKEVQKEVCTTIERRG